MRDRASRADDDYRRCRRKVTPPASTLNWADCMATFRPMGAVSKFMTDPMGEMSSKFAKT
jgi:hypothetical protein